MGNLCAADAQLLESPNPMHLKRLQLRPEVLPLLELHDFQGVQTSSAPGSQPFEDAEFPADGSSIGGVTGDAANPNCAQYLEEMIKLVVPGWVRPRQMIGKEAGQFRLFATEGEPCLFKHVSPRDIEQGNLGNCWLVSSMATVAEYPDRVRALFKQNALSEDGRYDVRLYDPSSEEWKVVTIDDRLPYWQRPGKHGNLCFAKPTKENEFWPCLLEKAVAKFVMSYHRLDGGYENIALEMLTGKPALLIGVNPFPEASSTVYAHLSGKSKATARHATVLMRKEGYDENWGLWGQDASSLVGGKHKLSDAELWAKLKAWDAEGMSLACGTVFPFKGILAGHAYTLLRLVEVPIARKKTGREYEQSTLKLLHVRNPHRTSEWCGRFHDDDWETWNAYPEALKVTGHKVGVKDNGVFWMEWSDFKIGFRDVAVCFDQQKGARYTDSSVGAVEEHRHVSFGIVGYQKWEGLR